jgi:hypothetical protein
MEIKPKELTEIKQQVSTVQQSAMSLVVENKEDMAKATDALHNVRQAEKFIEEKKKNITSPLMKSLSAIRDLFKPMELNLADANKTIKSKMLAWQIEEDDRIAKEQSRLEKRVLKGTMKAETAAGKLETLGEVNAGSQGEVGKSLIRTVTKPRCIDETLTPRKYLIPNVPLITEALLQKRLLVAGWELYDEKQVVIRSK